MTINRHNYETFFLLYVDKELAAADRKAVDVFVKENPDLLPELVLLQQAVVKADDIVLEKKDWLYMEAGISALQENLLMYADDELMPAEKRAVEEFLATDKKARGEWAILQQVKLQPDRTVVFADKQSLYRKEAGRVVGIAWWRVAAAAILLGFGLWTGVAVYKNYYKTTTGSRELAKDNKNEREQNKTDLPANNTTVITPAVENSTPQANTAATEKNKERRVMDALKTAVDNSNNPNRVISKDNITVRDNGNKKPGNNLPKPYLENINNKPGNESIVTNVLPSNNNSNRISGNDVAVVKTNPKENTNNVIAEINKSKTDPNVTALQAVNKTTADDGNNNRYLDVDDNKEKRTALGGFIRKAKRVLERTTNVKTGDGIKIAGFEIALK